MKDRTRVNYEKFDESSSNKIHAFRSFPMDFNLERSSKKWYSHYPTRHFRHSQQQTKRKMAQSFKFDADSGLKGDVKKARETIQSLGLDPYFDFFYLQTRRSSAIPQKPKTLKRRKRPKALYRSSSCGKLNIFSTLSHKSGSASLENDSFSYESLIQSSESENQAIELRRVYSSGGQFQCKYTHGGRFHCISKIHPILRQRVEEVQHVLGLRESSFSNDWQWLFATSTINEESKMSEDLKEFVPRAILHYGLDVFKMDSKRLHISMVELINEIFGSFPHDPLLPSIDLDFTNVLVQTILNQYRGKNVAPFHNARHAVSVAQFASLVTSTSFMQKHLNPVAANTFIVSALAHDLDHPGNDNYFETVTRSNNFKEYGAKSTLEHHHADTFMGILKGLWEDRQRSRLHDDFNGRRSSILNMLDLDLAVELILATDLKCHVRHVEFLRSLKQPEDVLPTEYGEVYRVSLDAIDELFSSDSSSSPTIDDEDGTKLLSLLKALLHACDLSGQCLDVHLALKFEENIFGEMRNEVIRLQECGLPIPGYLEFAYDKNFSVENRYKNQIGFIDHVVAPLWKEVGRLFPELEMFYQDLITKTRLFYIEHTANCVFS